MSTGQFEPDLVRLNGVYIVPGHRDRISGTEVEMMPSDCVSLIPLKNPVKQVGDIEPVFTTIGNPHSLKREFRHLTASVVVDIDAMACTANSFSRAFDGNVFD